MLGLEVNRARGGGAWVKGRVRTKGPPAELSPAQRFSCQKLLINPHLSEHHSISVGLWVKVHLHADTGHCILRMEDVDMVLQHLLADNFIYLFFVFCLSVCLGLHMWHMEVPRLAMPQLTAALDP